MADTPYTGYFNVHKYSDVAGEEPEVGTSFVSPSDYMADGVNGLGMVISFKHEPSGQSVFFKAFITALNESYSSDWTEESVYGRTDPIQLFKQTTRRISLGFKVPAETMGEAYDNLSRIASLTRFLYPSYTAVGSATTVAQGPVLRLKVMNLITKSGHGQNQSDRDLEDMDLAQPADSFAGYKSNPDASLGLLGVITSLNINHNLENADIGILEKDTNTVLSTMIEVSIDFTVIHEKTLGWTGSSFMDSLFPYNVTPASEEDARTASDRLRNSRTAQPEDPPANDERRAAAEARYLSLGGKARMKKDMKWLNKMSNKDPDTLTDRQKQNMAYLSETLQGAGVPEDHIGGYGEGRLSNRVAAAVGEGYYDAFVDS